MSDRYLNTPILLLVFNRPQTTRKVFEEIRRVRPKQLFVAADGPRKDVVADALNCDEARSILQHVDWPCEVKTLLRDENLGCGTAISSALDWFFENVPEGIILEDDCLPHPSFFPFCEKLLERYRSDTRIMMIGGSNFLRDPVTDDSYLFSRYFAIWGWASWRRAWKLYDQNLADWGMIKTEGHLSAQYGQPHIREALMSMFEAVRTGTVNTWDIQWNYSCLFNNGLSVVPRRNLVSNIGHVGTHAHSKDQNHDLPIHALDVENLHHPALVFPNYRYDDAFFRRNFSSNIIPQSLLSQAIHKGKKAAVVFARALARTAPKRETKPDPHSYSATLGLGSVVPCQIEAYFLALNKYVDEGASVLDVGFGLGYGLNILAIKAKEVSGVEVEEKSYLHCEATVKDRNPRLVHLSLYDGLHLPFPDDSFDVVTCVDVIEHVKDYEKLMREMLRVSRKGVFISTPNKRPEYTNPDGTPKNYWHLREWNFEEFHKILQSYGKIEWNFLNGVWEGPFTVSHKLQNNTQTLTPFIQKF